MAGVGIEAFWRFDFDADARGRETLRAPTGAKERATKGEEIMARRKTFQQGTVVERKYEYGTAFILRYRIRKLDGGWQEKSETLSNCSSKKAALKILSTRLQDINEKNGRTGSNQAERTFGDLLGSKWSEYLDKQSVKPSTGYAYESVLKKWIKPFFEKLLLEDIGADTVGSFHGSFGSEQVVSEISKECIQPPQGTLRDRCGIRSDASESNSPSGASS
jgi:Phage integrase, N-terminal SAM-like domain